MYVPVLKSEYLLPLFGNFGVVMFRCILKANMSLRSPVIIIFQNFIASSVSVDQLKCLFSVSIPWVAKLRSKSFDLIGSQSLLKEDDLDDEQL